MGASHRGACALAAKDQRAAAHLDRDTRDDEIRHDGKVGQPIEKGNSGADSQVRTCRLERAQLHKCDECFFLYRFSLIVFETVQVVELFEDDTQASFALLRAKFCGRARSRPERRGATSTQHFKKQHKGPSGGGRLAHMKNSLASQGNSFCMPETHLK
eukprot:1100432-Prymnesium_polylepis.1